LVTKEMTMHWGWDGGWWMMGIGTLVWVVVLVVVVWLVVKAVNTADRRPADGRGERDEALDLLRRRFANGEIDADEFEQRLGLLQRR
jgi:putative membrane protein